MSGAPPSAADEKGWVSVARIVKAHGVRGEMAADLETDFPERFARLNEVSLLRAGIRQEFRLVGHRFHHGRVLLRLEGIETPEQVRTWAGAMVQVPQASRWPLPSGRFYISDLEGCQVRTGDRTVGTIEAVATSTGAAPLLHVRAATGREVLIPFAAEFLESVDIRARQVNMRLPEGLLEVDD